MGHTLSLTDGSTTISLYSSGVQLVHYTPRVAEIQPDGVIGEVTEPIDVLIYGSTGSEVSSKVQALDDMFRRARARYWSGVGPRVFLQLALHSEGITYRAEVANGSVEPEKGALTAYTQGKARCTLLVTRMGFWEGSRVQIPISNTTGSNNISGLTIKVRDDSGDNWFGIDGDDVEGSLPAPLELRLTNNSGASRAYRNFRIANNTFGTGLTHIIEGESAAAISTSSSSSYSGGSYGYFTGLSGTFEWTLGSGYTSLIAGRRMHILARIAAMPVIGSNNVYTQCLVMDSAGVTPLYTAPEVLVTSPAGYFQMLGTVPLPPTAYDTSGPTVKLRCNFYCTTSGTVGIDYIQLTPAEDKSYRHLIQRGYSAPNNSIIVDDGIEGLAYLSVSNVNHPLYTARTQPVHVFPNTDQRIYVLHDGESASIDWSLSVKAYYRPRKITL